MLLMILAISWTQVVQHMRDGAQNTPFLTREVSGLSEKKQKKTKRLFTHRYSWLSSVSSGSPYAWAALKHKSNAPRHIL